MAKIHSGAVSSTGLEFSPDDNLAVTPILFPGLMLVILCKKQYYPNLSGFQFFFIFFFKELSFSNNYCYLETLWSWFPMQIRTISIRMFECVSIKQRSSIMDNKWFKTCHRRSNTECMNLSVDYVWSQWSNFIYLFSWCEKKKF